MKSEELAKEAITLSKEIFQHYTKESLDYAKRLILLEEELSKLSKNKESFAIENPTDSNVARPVMFKDAYKDPSTLKIVTEKGPLEEFITDPLNPKEKPRKVVPPLPDNDPFPF